MNGEQLALGVTVRTNAPAVVAGLRELTLRQIPFATAVALTRVAQDSRAEVVRNMPDHFKVRSQRVLKGVQIEKALKKDWPNPTAKVGTLDQFMALHATGGVKKPEKGAKRISVPTSLVVRTASGAVPSRLKPRRMRERKNVFVEGGDSSGAAVVQRFKANQGGQLSNLKGKGRFFTLVTEAHLKATWPIRQEVEETVRDTYQQHFERELTAAVRSARVKTEKLTREQAQAAYLVKRTELGRIAP